MGGATDCPNAGSKVPTTVAIVSIAAVATRRIDHPLPAGETGAGILHRAWWAAMGNAFNDAGLREVASIGARNRRLNELAAFGQLMQHGM